MMSRFSNLDSPVKAELVEQISNEIVLQRLAPGVQHGGIDITDSKTSDVLDSGLDGQINNGRNVGVVQLGPFSHGAVPLLGPSLIAAGLTTTIMIVVIPHSAINPLFTTTHSLNLSDGVIDADPFIAR